MAKLRCNKFLNIHLFVTNLNTLKPITSTEYTYFELPKWLKNNLKPRVK